MDNATLEDELVHEVWRQDMEAIKSLLAAGANPNQPGRSWSSAIACAGENDETGDIARLLVASGADINIQDTGGLTPLHHAVDIAIDGTVQSGRDVINWSVVDVFLALGADPTKTDKQGKTVYELASAYGYEARRSFDEFMASRNSNGQTT
jgi:ankyrin repeat protein